MRFIGPYVDEIDRGRGDLLMERIERGWPAFRGMAIEPLVREAVGRLLVDPDYSRRLNGARHVGSFWTRSNDVQVDLVGGSHPSRPDRIGFIGSIKWRENAAFTSRDVNDLAGQRRDVPGAEQAKLVGVSRRGFTDDAGGLDVKLMPDDLLAAW